MSATYLIIGLPAIVALCAATVAGIIDLRTFRIPNLLTFPLCVCGLAYNLLWHGVEGLEFGLFGMVTGLFALVLFYLVGAMGAGDVKLLAAVGAWLGPATTLYVFIAAALAAGLYSAVLLAWDGRLKTGLTTIYIWVIQLQTLGLHLARTEPLGELVRRGDRRRRFIPFGLMLGIGVAAVVLGGYYLGLGEVR